MLRKLNCGLLKMRFLPNYGLYANLIQKCFFHFKRKEIYQKCFHILGVEDTADQITVRQAYIEQVKKFHPDSVLPEANAELFQEVTEAYQVLQEKFAKNRRGIFDDEQIFDIRHTSQNRQYLNFIGFGLSK